MQVAVYGSIIYDTILEINGPLCNGGSHNCEKVSHRVGGLANFCRAGTKHYELIAVSAVGEDAAGVAVANALHEIKCAAQLTVIKEHLTSQATVIADLVNNNRTGIVQWGACRKRMCWYPILAAAHHHFMYLDRIIPPDLTKFKGTISADFCDSREVERYESLLPHIDYLIVSEDEDRPFAQRPTLPVRKSVIVHSPYRSYTMSRNTQRMEPKLPEGAYPVDSFIVNTVENGLNVVGAGDYFAAHCIANLLVGKEIDLEWVHSQTIRLLREQS